MKTVLLHFVLSICIFHFFQCESHAQWVQSALSNVDVSALVASGTDLIAGTNHCSDGSCVGTGVFHSTNDGTSWTDAGSGLTNTDVRSFAVSGTNLFAGTYGGGVFRSTDSGASWSNADSGLTKPYVYALAVSPDTSATLFAGTYGGVFRSTNNGTSWTKVNTGLTDTIVLSLVVSPNGAGGTNLFAGTCCDGVFRSTDNGTSWSHADSGIKNTEVWCFAVSDTNLFAGTYGDGIFLSTDNGTSWTAVNSGLNLQARDIRSFAVSGTNIFAGTDDGVYLSTNNGGSWSQLTGSHVTSFAVNGPNLFVGMVSLGVWRRPLSEMITSVKTYDSDLPMHFRLSQNYPNPFNPSTSIKYELPRASDIRLSVSDLLGREVFVLVHERKDAGVHEVRFDGSNLASGVYFYSLQVGTFTQTRNLLLLK